MDAGARRARSALTWMALAVAVLAAAGAWYLRPNLSVPPASPRPSPSAGPGETVVLGASFVDDGRGAISVADVALGPAASRRAYLTSDGGRTWRRGPELVYVGGGVVLQRGDGRPLTDRVSDDGGRTWSEPRPGPDLTAPSNPAPAVDGVGRLLLLEDRRLWVSEDDGLTWTSFVAQAPPGLFPTRLYRAGGSLIGLAMETAPANRERFVDAVLRSADGGAHWERVRLPA